MIVFGLYQSNIFILHVNLTYMFNCLHGILFFFLLFFGKHMFSENDCFGLYQSNIFILHVQSYIYIQLFSWITLFYFFFETQNAGAFVIRRSFQPIPNNNNVNNEKNANENLCKKFFYFSSFTIIYYYLIDLLTLLRINT